jgi:TPR repeat protein
MNEEQQQTATVSDTQVSNVPASRAQTLFNRALAAAEQGNPLAMLSVGDLHEKGVGVAKNFTKALTWYEKAMDAGNGEAAFRAGLCYEIGMGATADMGKGIAAYNKAMELESPRATHKMAMLYLSGYAQPHGLARDVVKGLKLLRQAAKAGEGAAYNSIALIFLHGQFGQQPDRDKALKSFTLSAKTGNLEGMKNLALLVADNQPVEALRWALIAQRGGLRAEGLPELITRLRSKVDEAGLRQAGEEAQQWIADYFKRYTKTASGKQPDVEGA